MDQHTLDTTYLGRPARIIGVLVHIRLSPDVEATFDRVTLDNIAYLFPTGLLRLHPDGKGRQYVEMRGREGAQERYPVARIILALDGVTDSRNRQAHYRDGNRYNLLPENLHLGEVGRLSGSDAAWQEVARRKWARAINVDPDVLPVKINASTPLPAHKRIVEPVPFPHIPADYATLQCTPTNGFAND